jgi:hypothetical protein
MISIWFKIKLLKDFSYNKDSSKEYSMKDFLSSNHQQILSQASGTSSPLNSASTQTPAASDVWRDPVWQSLGVIVGAVLALVAIIISLRQWQRKSLVYEVISKENIVRVADHSVGSELQISYPGKPVKDLHLITVKFINSGNTEIRPEDYVRQVSLNFGENSEILGNKILEQEPNNLGLKINHEKSQEALLVDPVLLNRRDFFTIQALVTGFQSVNTNGRIAGVTRIREVTTLKLNSETLSTLVGMVVAITGLLTSLAGLVIQTTFFSSDNFKVIIPVVLVSVISLIVKYVADQLPQYKIKKK